MNNNFNSNISASNTSKFSSTDESFDLFSIEGDGESWNDIDSTDILSSDLEFLELNNSDDYMCSQVARSSSNSSGNQ